MLLSGYYSETGRCARSLMGLSAKSGTQTRVSPSTCIRFTKEWAKFISDLPLSSLYSFKIPRVPVLCSNPFSNFVQLRVPLVQCISSLTSKVPVSS